VTVPFGEERATIGLYDAAESNKLNLQLGRDLTSLLSLRYGVYASKPGIGVDYVLSPRVSLRGDLFGLNDPQMDFRVAYGFGQGFNAWAGIERVFQRPMVAFGVGVKK
jgi:hypothetical protein